MPNPFFSCPCRGRFLKRPFFAASPGSLLKPSPQFFLTLSSLVRRSGRGICFFFFALALTALAANSEPKRPKILGIAFVQVFASDPAAAKGFYESVGLMRANYTTSETPEQ